MTIYTITNFLRNVCKVIHCYQVVWTSWLSGQVLSGKGDAKMQGKSARFYVYVWLQVCIYITSLCPPRPSALFLSNCMFVPVVGLCVYLFLVLPSYMSTFLSFESWYLSEISLRRIFSDFAGEGIYSDFHLVISRFRDFLWFWLCDFPF